MAAQSMYQAGGPHQQDRLGKHGQTDGQTPRSALSRLVGRVGQMTDDMHDMMILSGPDASQIAWALILSAWAQARKHLRPAGAAAAAARDLRRSAACRGSLAAAQETGTKHAHHMMHHWLMHGQREGRFA